MRKPQQSRRVGGVWHKCMYVNNKTKMDWECGTCGHVWPAVFASIRSVGTWCPPCSGNTRLSIEVAKRIAVERGGECLSEEYKNNNSPLLWRCGKDGTEWPASLNKVKDAGHWCPTCAGNLPLSIEEAKEIAVSRGGLCLSTKYVNTSESLEWWCGKCEDTWPSPLASVKGGTARTRTRALLANSWKNSRDSNSHSSVGYLNAIAGGSLTVTAQKLD